MRSVHASTTYLHFDITCLPIILSIATALLFVDNIQRLRNGIENEYVSLSAQMGSVYGNLSLTLPSISLNFLIELSKQTID